MEQYLLNPILGLFGGLVLGYIARRNFFCTLTGLEQYWYGNSSAGLRSWVLAALVAIVIVQTSIHTGWLDPSDSFYLTPRFSWLGAIVGGWCFGYGMALVGTCGFGALIRLGGGSLKSLIAVIILGLSAMSTQRGLLSFGRLEQLEFAIIDFSAAGDQSIPSIIGSITGTHSPIVVTSLICFAGFTWVFWEPAFRKNHKAILTGSIVGAVVTFGWFATTWVSQTTFEPVQIESASFVAPISDAIFQFTILLGHAPDYGVGMVFGVVVGSAIAALSADDIRWEACDDARELSRHIVGATLMGFGGILSLGCTIGQGVSAASLLSISAPVVFISIIVGAKMGLGWLLEGSLIAPFMRYE